MIPNDWVDSLQNELKKFFIDKGFSEAEIKTQLGGMGEIVVASTVLELLKQKPVQQKFASEDEAVKYIETNFSKEEVGKTFKQQAESLFKEYLDTIDQPDSAAATA